MVKLEPRHQKIIRIFLEKGKISSSVAHAELQRVGENISLPTVKRNLSELAGEDILTLTGKGRSTSYEISAKGRVFSDIDAKEYCSVEPDKRYGLRGYNFDLLRLMPADIFTADEMKNLEDATSEYKKRTENLSQTVQKKELERLVIELSWKSSKIEGNTYTLLDTEKLILENKEAPGHSKDEARMILNHKDAFYYVRENKEQFKTITRKNMEELHAILMKDLHVNLGLRTTLVGITGSLYRPLDNIYQITEAIKGLATAVSRMQTPYAKALLALLGIRYIQPFEDGNKRTSRLMTNALLLAHSFAPLSYRSVDENDYRESILAFYELNSIVPMKKIFISQYEFAARNYAVK
jgi:Fic family protein